MERAKRAKISKHISWHCARHSFATNILDNGAHIAVLLDFEKRKSKEEELIDEEIVAFLNQIRNSSKDAREEIKRRFAQRDNFNNRLKPL